MKKGTTRWVFFIGDYAFKIPSLFGWKYFLKGLICNLNELYYFKMSKSCIEYPFSKFCPIVFYLPLGLLIVMPKVRVLKRGEITKKELKRFCMSSNNRKIIPAEYKYDSFGYYNNKLVVIDYGD